MSRALIPGFDYRMNVPIELTRADWRTRLRVVIANGGYRATEKGETFAHGKDGRLVFEVYAIIPA